jgi:3-deoxy-7-phosphoheptulonate synthase
MPQYIADLVCWGAIGARTTESQTHRQLASGLSMPIGFKNGTDGSLQSAVNAIKAASQSQTFLSIRRDGVPAAVRTRGNRDCHVVLRGGARGPNYSAPHIAETELLLSKASLPASILVDASHDNSLKKPELQPEVIHSLIAQIQAGNHSIMGAMVESNLHAGNQTFPAPKESLRHGVSITDGCIDWATTEILVRELHTALAHRFA